MRPNRLARCYRPQSFLARGLFLLSCTCSAASLSALAQGAPDELLVAGFSSATVSRYDAADGTFLSVLDPSANLAGVLGIASGLDGMLYVCSESNDRVVRFDPETGDFLGDFIADDPATPQDETGGLDGPSGIVFGRDGRAYVASFSTDAILVYDGFTGDYIADFVPSGTANLDGPDAGMAFGPDGHLYVPSFFTNRIKRYDGATGAFLGNLLAPGFAPISRPRAIVFPGDGFAYVASEGNDRILRTDLSVPVSVESFIFDDPAVPGDETGGLEAPTGVAFGPDGRLYVTSLGQDAVLSYGPGGTFAGTFVPPGSGGVDAPTFLLFRPAADFYCSGMPNSAGPGGRLGVEGSASPAADNLELTARALPAGVSGIFFYGTAPLALPFGDGLRCVGGATFRLPLIQAGPDGFASLRLDFSSPPRPEGQIAPGSTWHFQCWYRDPAGPGNTGSNTTNAAAVHFGP